MIKRVIKPLLAGCLLLGLAQLATAETFKVASIDVQGAQRITKATIINDLGVNVGQDFNTANSSKYIRSLYDSHFFSSVSLAKRGNTLIVIVEERPTIASIKIDGYQSIDKDKINDVLKNAGLVEGDELDRANLKKFTESLQQQYYQMGRYNAAVTETVTKPDSRNRVSVNVNVSEGRVAKIEQIQILGTKTFSEHKLVDQLDIDTTNILSFFTKDDEYSRDKLDTSADKLIDFYQDHGYLHAKVDSVQAQLSPKRDAIYVTFKITEGDQYKVSTIKILGNTIIPLASVEKMLQLKSGDVFSKSKLKDSQKSITDALGDKGYAFANITVTPTVDDVNKTAALVLFVDPGQKVYVRHVTFTGNNQTAENVLRREVRQLEGSLSSTREIQNSEQRIKNNLGTYIQDAKSGITPVPGKADQVDLNYNVTETPPANAMVQISYGTDGFGYGASLTNNNWLGTGKSMSVVFNRTPYVTNYSLNYLNPYYTIDGISRGFSIYANNYNNGAVNIANFSDRNYGGSVTYGVPISEKNDQITFGYGYESTTIGVGNAPSAQITSFFQDQNISTTSTAAFNQLILSTGWGRNNLDRAIFPTKGVNQVVDAKVYFPLGVHKLEYYKGGYTAHAYYPLGHDFVLSGLGAMNYGMGFGGTDQLPFFQNYYVGGVGSIRGFDTNSLGPRDSLGNSIGGNLEANASAALIFPNFISPNSLRTSWFFDGGNVYNTRRNTASWAGGGNPKSGPVRVSTGLNIEWRIPMVGLISFSFAEPLNAQRGDSKDFFQFNFGTQF